MNKKTLTLSVKVTGRVQGVGYRWWTLSRASALNLKGWVRNDPTGSVTALFQGPEDVVERMVTELWDGPGSAAVRDVRTDRVANAPAGPGFRILG